MDGLECSEVNYSLIIENNRYDSEYFLKRYALNENKLKSLPHYILADKYKITDGEHGSVEYLNMGIKYLTAENIKKGYVDIDNVKYVSSEVDQKNKRARVEAGDVLISIKGTLGEVAVAEKWLLPCNMNRDVAIIKSHDKTNIFSNYLAIFLMCKYGYIQSQRGGSGGVQQMITLERLRSFVIPYFPNKFYEVLEKIHLKFQNKLIMSKEFYEKSEQLLLSSLGMNKFTPSTENVSIKTFSESFGSSGRIDAEYYYPKYEAYEKWINCSETVQSLCELHDKTFMPKENEEYKYIELANVGSYGVISDVEVIKGSELPSRARRKVKAGQVIISSVEGSLESCALITGEYDNAICSTGFYVLSSNTINPATLLVLFKSEPIQAMLKKRCSGTILTAITKEEFLKMPLPCIEQSAQDTIAAYIYKSFKLRKQAVELLEKAKTAVEIAIEKGEEKAIDYLNESEINDI